MATKQIARRPVVMRSPSTIDGSVADSPLSGASTAGQAGILRCPRSAAQPRGGRRASRHGIGGLGRDHRLEKRWRRCDDNLHVGQQRTPRQRTSKNNVKICAGVASNEVLESASTGGKHHGIEASSTKNCGGVLVGRPTSRTGDLWTTHTPKTPPSTTTNPNNCNGPKTIQKNKEGGEDNRCGKHS